MIGFPNSLGRYEEAIKAYLTEAGVEFDDLHLGGPRPLAVRVASLELDTHSRTGCTVQPLASLVLGRPLPHARQIGDERPHPVDGCGDFKANYSWFRL